MNTNPRAFLDGMFRGLVFVKRMRHTPISRSLRWRRSGVLSVHRIHRLPRLGDAGLKLDQRLASRMVDRRKRVL